MWLGGGPSVGGTLVTLAVGASAVSAPRPHALDAMVTTKARMTIDAIFGIPYSYTALFPHPGPTSSPLSLRPQSDAVHASSLAGAA